MSTFFGLIGADVLGIDVNPETESIARDEAERQGVRHRVQFTTYSGMPQDLLGGLDVIFAKSILVLFPHLNEIALAMATALRPGGRLLVLENARGPLPIHLVRMLRRRSLHPHGAHCFTENSVEIIRRLCDVRLEHWTVAPPTCLVGAIGRGAAPGRKPQG